MFFVVVTLETLIGEYFVKQKQGIVTFLFENLRNLHLIAFAIILLMVVVQFISFRAQESPKLKEN